MPPSSLFYSLHLSTCRSHSSSLWALGCRLPHSQRYLDFPLPSSQTVSERIGEIISRFEKKGFYLKAQKLIFARASVHLFTSL